VGKKPAEETRDTTCFPLVITYQNKITSKDHQT